MSAANSDNNTKIRADKMDIKVIVKKWQGLEQWAPRMQGEFPMSVDVIRDELFPAFSVPVPDFDRSSYTLDQFRDEIVLPHKDLAAVRVFKRRFGYTVNGCMTEIADLLINGAAIRTIAVESGDGEAVLRAKDVLGLTEYENVNYLLAIKRIIGMERLPA
jgi:hypothetical protein